MSAFQAVNTGLAPEPYNRNGDETTPTTPRPSTAPSTQNMTRLDDATTPTRATFGALANQRPLPESPFPAAISVPENTDAENKSLTRGDSQYSAKSNDSGGAMDAMDDSDEEGHHDDGSDEEGAGGDGTRSMKKKKSQRFWCTEYPPCNLSFTRSEHLARHIRKHTGERPFQCHCSRRFSRLDNLRQHAQTVHVNEDIPGDSLAATGTRFQRQVRTDRVRPTGNRSRASTAGSQPGQGRGHHRNSLSASSISSIGSAYSQRDDVRRRPPPLVMAAESRARLSLENYSNNFEGPGQYQAYRPQSPGGFSTPTSATFSTGQNSPHWGASMQSPMSSHSRTSSLYAGHRTPGRRLSVPSSGNPFQSPHGSSFGPTPLTPLNTSNQGVYSPSSSMLGSPTTSTSGSSWSRRESFSNTSDDAWRRRTWHPESASNFTSRLVNVTTPNYYQSAPAPAPAQNPQSTRLPGIESFDPLPRPVTPPNRGPSPMVIDTPSRAPMPQSSELYSRPEERRSNPQWDMGLHRNMNRLDIAQGPPPPSDTAGAWASEANRALQAQAEHAQAEQARNQPTVRYEPSAYNPPREPAGSFQPQHVSAPPVTPREAKRHGWYHGPVLVQSQGDHRQRTSPEDSSSSEGGVPGTPGSASMADYHPSIVHSSGWVEPSQRPQQAHYQNYPASGADGAYSYGAGPRNLAPSAINEEPKNDGMLRLEALVAVATSEENATIAY